MQKHTWLLVLLLLLTLPVLGCDDNGDDDDDDVTSDGDTDDDDDDVTSDGDTDDDDEDGDIDGDEDGDIDGDEDGDIDGDEDGDIDGDEDGDIDGDEDGDIDGDEDGDIDGDEDGDIDGDEDGDIDGDEDGDIDGDEDGDIDGDEEIVCDDPGEAFVIPDEIGQAIVLTGELSEDDPLFDRLYECGDTEADEYDVYYDTFEIYNDGTEAKTITIIASWDDDGFLFVYDSPFDADNPTVNCMDSNDDLGEDTDYSQITDLVLQPCQKMVVVATSYDPELTLNYSIEIGMPGEVNLGDTCGGIGFCPDGSVCYGDPLVCTAISTLNVGDACDPDNPTAVCPDGSVCYGEPLVCTAISTLNVGDGCDPDNPTAVCPDGSVCYGEPLVCTAISTLNVGDACDPDNPTAVCPDGSVCYGDPMVCTQATPPSITNATGYYFSYQSESINSVKILVDGQDTAGDVAGYMIDFIDHEGFSLPGRWLGPERFDNQGDIVGQTSFTGAEIYYVTPISNLDQELAEVRLMLIDDMGVVSDPYYAVTTFATIEEIQGGNSCDPNGATNFICEGGHICPDSLVCDSPCNLYAESSECSEGQSCMLHEDWTGGICMTPGSAGVSESCDETADCQAGLFCFSGGPESLTCEKLCRLSDGEGCGEGETCSMMAPPSVTDYGVCELQDL